MAGITIGWLSLHYYHGGNDYWDVNREGWEEYRLLGRDPGEYFANIFRSNYAKGYSGLFDSFQSFWSDLKNNLVIKLVSVFDIFSQGNYYINSLFFNYLVFFGHVALYRLFNKIYEGQSIRILIGCFLLPSLLYFSSGIHKDGLVFLLLALLAYAVFQSLQKKQFSLKRIVIIVITISLLFLFRNFLLLALLPSLTAWIIAVRMKWQAWACLTIAFLISGIILFNVNAVFPSVDPLKAIVQRQADFLQLPLSSTPLNLDTLHPAFGSFLQNAPQAINHLLLRPYITELPSPILLPMNIELFIYQLLFLLLLVVHKKRTLLNLDPVIPFFLFFTGSVFLLIGYIVPNLGSLIRYRSIYLPFIITPLLCSLDLIRLGGIFKIKK